MAHEKRQTVNAIALFQSCYEELTAHIYHYHIRTRTGWFYIDENMFSPYQFPRDQSTSLNCIGYNPYLPK